MQSVQLLLAGIRRMFQGFLQAVSSSTESFKPTCQPPLPSQHYTLIVLVIQFSDTLCQNVLSTEQRVVAE